MVGIVMIFVLGVICGSLLTLMFVRMGGRLERSIKVDVPMILFTVAYVTFLIVLITSRKDGDK